MPRYWIIAPHENDETYETVWNFDHTKDCISIGWHEIGDPSKFTRDQLLAAVAEAFPKRPPQAHKASVRMIWSFWHEISLGDVIVARRGKSIVAGVGDVTEPASYTPGRNPHITHPNFIGVAWRAEPTMKQFDRPVFPMQTVTEARKEQLDALDLLEPVVDAEPIVTPSQQEFVFEKYVQEFIVYNWSKVAGLGDLSLYKDEDSDGEQYPTDVGKIDILATDPQSNDFVVIELKKGRSSDEVLGQILRYMGWVKKNLCKNGQSVRGLIICKDKDEKLLYSLDMVQSLNIRAKYYDVTFSLKDNA